MTPHQWKKSSYSYQKGDCVEVAHLAPRVSVRDSKHPDAVVVNMEPTEWLLFIADLKR